MCTHQYQRLWDKTNGPTDYAVVWMIWVSASMHGVVCHVSSLRHRQPWTTTQSHVYAVIQVTDGRTVCMQKHSSVYSQRDASPTAWRHCVVLCVQLYRCKERSMLVDRLLKFKHHSKYWWCHNRGCSYNIKTYHVVYILIYIALRCTPLLAAIRIVLYGSI